MPKRLGPLPKNSLAAGLFKSQTHKLLAQNQNNSALFFIAHGGQYKLYKLLDKNQTI